VYEVEGEVAARGFLKIAVGEESKSASGYIVFKPNEWARTLEEAQIQVGKRLRYRLRHMQCESGRLRRLQEEGIPLKPYPHPEKLRAVRQKPPDEEV